MNIDQSIYKGMRNILSSSGQLQCVFEMFRNNNSSRLHSLHEHIAKGNINQSALILHAIKGSCRMFGEIECADTCERIEKNILASNTPPGQADLEELKIKLNAFTDFLGSDAKAGSSPESTSLRNAQQN